MLSVKKIILFLISVFLLQGCSKKDAENTPQENNAVNTVYLEKQVKGVINTDAKFILRGKFDVDPLTEFSSGSEVMNKKEWGIKFYLFTLKNGTAQKKYETPLLNGSFKSCKVEKINLVNSDHDFVYYNSMSYFMGSGGGEVLAYIIDLKDQIIYYAHLVVEPEGKVEFYMSPNNAIVNKFFLNVFKKDYPTLKLASKDPVLD